MRLADIKFNDIVDGEGVCVSVWFQGCPHRCPGCHNPETWDFDGGSDISYELVKENILAMLRENGVERNLSLLGGEPLCDENIVDALSLAAAVKREYPDTKIFCWTGSTYEALLKKYGSSTFDNIDVLIDGPFILEQRDLTLYLRGSKNQRVLYKGIDF